MRKVVLIGLLALILGALVLQTVAAAFPIHVASVSMPYKCYRRFERGAIRIYNPNSWNVPVLIIWPTSGWEDGQEEATLSPGEARSFGYTTPHRGWDLYSAEVYVWFDHDTNIQVSFLNDYCVG